MDAVVARNYTPHAKQRAFHASKRRFDVASAGVRGGKTTAASAEFPIRIYRDIQAGRCGAPSGRGRLRRPRWHGWVVGPTFSLLKEAFRCLFETVPRELIEAWYPSDNSLWLKPDILIEGKSAEKPQNLVAVGLNGLWVTEAARLKSETWSGSLRSRLSDKNGWAIFDTSPWGGKTNWLYAEIIAKALEGDREFGHTTWTTADNTAIPWLADEVATARRQLPPAYFARDYLASWDSFAGLVYGEWDETIHVTTDARLRFEYGIPREKPLTSIFQRVIGAIDWGFVDPSCILAVGDTGREIIVLEESYGPGRATYDPRFLENTLAGEAKRLRDKWGISRFFADPSNPGDRFDFQRGGFATQSAWNDILFGVKRVAGRLHPVDGKPRLRVMDTCTNLRREIVGYVWKQAQDGINFVEVPMDGNNHALDALRYAVAEFTQHEDMIKIPASAPQYTGRPSIGPIG